MGKNCAITIGINQYYNLTSLKYAKRDAKAIRDYLLDDANFETIYHFSDDSPPIPTGIGTPLRTEPTFGNLVNFLDRRFDQSFLGAGDNLWFFFAGHGKRDRGLDYLMLKDSNHENPERTALPIRTIADYLKNSGADNIILILDACRNEGERDARGIGLATHQGAIAFFSCSPYESSYEIDELQHGAFTYALLAGFQNGEALATVERLDEYLRFEVPALSHRFNKPQQNPYTVIEPITKRHLILLPTQVTSTDLSASIRTALEAEVEDNLELAQSLWLRILSVRPNEQQAIKAIQRLTLKSSARGKPLQQQMQQVLSNLASSLSPSPKSIPSLSSIQTPPATASPQPTRRLTFEFEVVIINEKGEKIEPSKGKARYRSETLPNHVSLELILIPPGKFLMGSPDSELARQVDEVPQHGVTVNTFLLGKYPVTQAQWKAIADLPKVDRDLNPTPSYFKGDNHPVEMISWYDAIEFCTRLSQYTGCHYRLPSEAEWEYACRADTATPYHFGRTITPELANYNGNLAFGSGPTGIYRRETTEVGIFQAANSFGLYDMHGNVLEWCLDCWHESYTGSLEHSAAWTELGDSHYRLLRGGAWSLHPQYCRSANRTKERPDFRSSRIGFRVACSSATRKQS